MKNRIALLLLVTTLLFLPKSGYSAELLTNGSFETGNLTGWTAGTTQTTPWCSNWTVTTSAGGCTAFATPVDGTRDAMNGFDGTGGEFFMYQNITIPAASSAVLTVRFRAYWTISSSTSLSRTFLIEIRNPTTNAVLSTPFTFTAASGLSSQDTGWQTVLKSLHQYAGQTVRVYFRQIVPQTYTGPGQFELDGLSVQTLGPTAAMAEVGGMVQTANGYGIPYASVRFIDSNGDSRVAVSNQFGYFRFEQVEVGSTYVLEAAHKRYLFPNGPLVVNVTEDRKDLVFTAASEFEGNTLRKEPE